ncbi:MAG: response regulator [Rhodobacteraceae bacterium]|nr:response regulator [Paracoccaceae bacterium]
MTTDANSLADQIRQNLPFLRRYARALTGSQVTGDAYAVATLETILKDPNAFGAGGAAKVALFRAFHRIWTRSGAEIAVGETGLLATVQARLAGLTSGAREALLLNTIEEMPASSIALIMDLPVTEVDDLIAVARREMTASSSGRVMIIEDEAIIAMDLKAIVQDIGHEAVGIARTAQQAIELGQDTRPDLVLADIRLADNSSGIDAVNRLLTDFDKLPVIFVTAYPERLLTGERPEPAFLIAKPYSEAQIRSAVSQALFFASTETLQS